MSEYLIQKGREIVPTNENMRRCFTPIVFVFLTFKLSWYLVTRSFLSSIACLGKVRITIFNAYRCIITVWILGVTPLRCSYSITPKCHLLPVGVDRLKSNKNICEIDDPNCEKWKVSRAEEESSQFVGTSLE